jgi:hypothetical protein
LAKELGFTGTRGPDGVLAEGEVTAEPEGHGVAPVLGVPDAAGADEPPVVGEAGADADVAPDGVGEDEAGPDGAGEAAGPDGAGEEAGPDGAGAAEESALLSGPAAGVVAQSAAVRPVPPKSWPIASATRAPARSTKINGIIIRPRGRPSGSRQFDL